MGSTLCTNGPWFCIGEPDYEAPKRAFEEMMQHFVPDYEFKEASDDLECLLSLPDSEAMALFHALDLPMYRDLSSFDSLTEAVNEMEHIIDSFPDYMTDSRASMGWVFANGARWFLAAGEDYGRYGDEIADEAQCCDNRWFLMTGWKPSSEFNLTPKEE